MPKLEYFLVCESVSTDRDTNRVSIFHVVEELRPPKIELPNTGPKTSSSAALRPVPASEYGHILAQLVAVCCWYQTDDDADKDFQAMLRLRTPEGTTHDFPMNFTMNSRRQRLLFHLQGIPPLMPGELAFEILLNGEHKAEHIVTVHPPGDSGA